MDRVADIFLKNVRTFRIYTGYYITFVTDVKIRLKIVQV